MDLQTKLPRRQRRLLQRFLVKLVMGYRPEKKHRIRMSDINQEISNLMKEAVDIQALFISITIFMSYDMQEEIRYVGTNGLSAIDIANEILDEIDACLSFDLAKAIGEVVVIMNSLNVSQLIFDKKINCAHKRRVPTKPV
jgi:hypothetical protein